MHIGQSHQAPCWWWYFFSSEHHQRNLVGGSVRLERRNAGCAAQQRVGHGELTVQGRLSTPQQTPPDRVPLVPCAQLLKPELCSYGLVVVHSGLGALPLLDPLSLREWYTALLRRFADAV
jgi:hypothetical protein